MLKICSDCKIMPKFKEIPGNKEGTCLTIQCPQCKKQVEAIKMDFGKWQKVKANVRLMLTDQWNALQERPVAIK